MNSLDFFFEKREVDEFIGANVKLSSEEHMSRNRRAMLNGMVRLACLSV